MLAQYNKIVYYKLRLQKGRCVMDFTVIILVFIIILQLAVIFMLYRSRAGAVDEKDLAELVRHFEATERRMYEGLRDLRSEQATLARAARMENQSAADRLSEQLDKRLLRDFEEAKNKQFKNALDHLFPAKLIPVMIELSDISPEKKVNEISREERKAFGSLIKELPMTVTGTRSFAEAIITQGGISVKDINPSTMESKRVRHLYFAGEVLDLDAMTGGFNLQIAWSTGHLAGDSIQ